MDFDESKTNNDDDAAYNLVELKYENDMIRWNDKFYMNDSINIKSTLELVSAFLKAEVNSDESAAYTKWLKLYVLNFENEMANTLSPNRVMEYKELCKIKDSELGSYLLIQMIESISQNMKTNIYNKNLLSLLCSCLQSIDANIFGRDCKILYDMTSNIVKALNPIENDVELNKSTYVSFLPLLQSLNILLSYLGTLAPSQSTSNKSMFCINMDKFFEAAKEHTQYIPFTYQLCVAEQSYRILTNFPSENMKKAANILLGMLYITQGLLELKEFSIDIDTFSKGGELIKDVIDSFPKEEQWFADHTSIMIERTKVLMDEKSMVSFEDTLESIVGKYGNQNSSSTKPRKRDSLKALLHLPKTNETKDKIELHEIFFSIVSQMKETVLSSNHLSVQLSTLKLLIKYCKEYKFMDEDFLANEISHLLGIIYLEDQIFICNKEELSNDIEVLSFYNNLPESIKMNKSIDKIDGQLLQSETNEVFISVKENLLSEVDKARNKYDLDPMPNNVAQYFLREYFRTDHFKYFKPIFGKEKVLPIDMAEYNFMVHLVEDIETSKEDNSKSKKITEKRVDVSDFFKLKVKTVLVTGNPGMGKSSCCHKFVYMWTKKQLFQEFPFVYLLPVRKISKELCQIATNNQDKYNMLSIIIAHICYPEINIETEYKRLLRCISKSLEFQSTLIILDGLDEKACTSEVILAKILKGQHSLLILSRPYGMGNIELKIDLSVESSELLPTQIDQYIKNYFKNERSASLIKKLRDCNNFYKHLGVPLNLNIVCSLWDSKDPCADVNKNLDSTRFDTEFLDSGSTFKLFETVCNRMWRHYSIKLKENENKTIVREDLFNSLSTLAIACTEEGKIFFDEDFVLQNMEFDDQKFEMVQKCGFLVEKNGDYFFPHLTFQEFFAGMKLSQQIIPTNENSKEFRNFEDLILKLIKNKSFNGCIPFTAAFLAKKDDLGLFVILLKFLKPDPSSDLTSTDRLVLSCFHEWICNNLNKSEKVILDHPLIEKCIKILGSYCGVAYKEILKFETVVSKFICNSEDFSNLFFSYIGIYTLSQDTSKYLMHIMKKLPLKELLYKHSEDRKNDVLIACIASNTYSIPIESIKSKLKENLPKNYNKGQDLDNLYEKIKNYMMLLASINGELERMELLLQLGSNLDARYVQGETALILAASYGHIDIVKYLIEEKGADTNATNNQNGSNALHLAAEKGHIDIAKYLIEGNYFDLNSTDKRGNNVLHLAAFGGLIYIVKYLVEDKNVDMNVVDASGHNALHIATQQGYIDIVKYLIEERNADVYSFTNYGLTVLFLAAQEGHIDIVKYLIDERDIVVNLTHGNVKVLHHAASQGQIDIVKYLIEEKNANVNSTDNFHANILHNAAECGQIDLVKYSIEEKDIDIYSTNIIGYNALHFAAFNGYFDIVVYLIEERDLDVNSTTRDGSNALLLSALGGFINIVKYLTEEKDIDVYSSDNDGKNALHIAASYGYIDIVKYLIDERNIDVNSTTNDGKNALHKAAYGCYSIDVVKYLIDEKDINIYSTDNDGKNALLLSAYGNRINFVRYFIDEKEIDIYSTDNDGQNALHIAAYEGLIDIVKYLIEERNIDVNSTTNDGKNALLKAAYGDYSIGVVKYLIEERNFDVHLTDNKGNNALHLAALYGRMEIVKYLVEEKGFDVNATDNDGFNTLHIAAQEGQSDIVKYLKELKVQV